MNTRRQTVWLVSMLSIMVVLSAYYLFTEDAEEIPMAGEEFTLNESGLLIDGLTLDEIAAGGSSAANTSETNSMSDEEILRVMEAQTTMGSGYFTSLQMKRQEDFSKEMDRLMSIVNDTEQNAEAINVALEQYTLLEDLHQKLDYIEAELMRDYQQATITEDGNKWKVIVQTDSLERSEVVSILDLVMNELGISMNQVTVQTRS